MRRIFEDEQGFTKQVHVVGAGGLWKMLFSFS